MLLGRLKYIQMNLLYLNLFSLVFRWLLKSWKDVNNQLMIKFKTELTQAERRRVSSDIHELNNTKFEVILTVYHR